MKLLFDNGTPKPLREQLAEHDVDTAYERGWARISNGDLLDYAEREGYELLITTDQNIRHQQNISGRRIGIVVLMDPRWPIVRSQTADIRATINSVQPGEVREVPRR